jgi:L-threonylcarbamoyladenylate synthase
MMKTSVLIPSEVSTAAALLKEGHPVAFPTETVYGLGAPIFQPKAIEKIFSLKGRPNDNPLIVHISDLSQVFQIARDIPDDFRLIADHFFPGPLTVVLLKHPAVPMTISAGLDTIAFRMPSHPVARELIHLVGEPLAAPSANLSGRPSSTRVEHVLQDFEGRISAVLDGGDCGVGLESTVISLLDPKHPVLLRPGAVTQTHLEEILGRHVGLPARNAPIASPGMKYRHYAPKASVKLFTCLNELDSHCRTQSCKRMLLTACALPELNGIADFFLLCPANLYAQLRFADQAEYQEIVIFCDEDMLSNAALMNRLTHAAAN